MSQRIVPMIAYEDAAAAIDWLTEAFGFREHGNRYVMEDGSIGHAELELGGEIVMLATPNREYQSPKRHRESCAPARDWLDNPWSSTASSSASRTSTLITPEPCAAGANVIRPPEDGPAGRLYTTEDLEGHRWMFQQL